MATGIALLALTGVTGITDSEKVMPVVLQELLPVGIRGIVIAGLLAAFMSTFSSTVNSGASFIVRDIWQPYFKPNAGDKESVRFSYWATFVLVLVGIIIGSQVGSIAKIWNWIMMVLGAGLAVPNVLRWYWWRINGWGYSMGTFSGIILSIIVLLLPEMPVYYVFPSICLVSLLVSIIVSLATKSTDTDILTSFYKSVRPFGLWKQIAQMAELSEENLSSKAEGVQRTILNVVLAMIAITGLYLFPMYLVGHWYLYSAIWFTLAAITIIALKYTWYDYLPESGAKK
jgi:Na+/proline symporter